MAEPSTETTEVARVERPWKLAVQAVLAFVALVALAWLGNLVFGGGSWAPGLADTMARDTWIAWLLLGLALLLVAEIILLKPSYRTMLRGVAPVEFEIQSTPRPAAPGDAVQYLVGCTGCGTVFERTASELKQAFSCPNCSRDGLLKDRSVHKAIVRSQACARCGNPFKAYHETAECPVCHAVNAA